MHIFHVDILVNRKHSNLIRSMYIYQVRFELTVSTSKFKCFDVECNLLSVSHISLSAYKLSNSKHWNCLHVHRFDIEWNEHVAFIITNSIKIHLCTEDSAIFAVNQFS